MQQSSRFFSAGILLIGLVLSACGPSTPTPAPTALPPAPTAGTGGAAPTAPAAATRPPAATSGAPAAAATTAPAPARKVSGKLVIYSALNESTNNAFVAAFKNATPGVDVDVLPLAAAGELQTRITTEKNSPKADVFIGGSSEFHDPLGKQGLIEPYKSPNAAGVDAAFKDAN